MPLICNQTCCHIQAHETAVNSHSEQVTLCLWYTLDLWLETSHKLLNLESQISHWKHLERGCNCFKCLSNSNPEDKWPPHTGQVLGHTTPEGIMGVEAEMSSSNKASGSVDSLESESNRASTTSGSSHTRGCPGQT